MQHDPKTPGGPVDVTGALGHAFRVFETSDELSTLDSLLAASFERAGEHLVGIISPDRRLSATDLTRYLVGVRHLVVATVTANGEPRCSAVDGLFLHGQFWFSTSAQSIKAGHLARRTALSAAHVIGDDVGVFVHGRARVVTGGPGEADELRHYWTEVYGASPEDWVATPLDARYVAIEASSMYSYAFSRERFEELCDREASTRAD
jgi:Pyridoxamine 5'-phosphate oxidase